MMMGMGGGRHGMLHAGPAPGGGRAMAPLMGAAAVGFAVGAGALGMRKLAMQATTGFAGDWMAVLKADHAMVDHLFNALAETKDSQTVRRHLLTSKIVYALAKHQFEEEHVVYQALRDGGPADVPRRLDSEHFEMKALMHELLDLPKGDPSWLSKAKTLHKLVQEHVREEEEIVFPALHGRLTKAQNAHLTRAMHREGLKLA